MLDISTTAQPDGEGAYPRSQPGCRADCETAALSVTQETNVEHDHNEVGIGGLGVGRYYFNAVVEECAKLKYQQLIQ
jgi:hypothetical protein